METKHITSKQASVSLQAKIVSDYKTGQYTYETLAEKHNTTRDTVYRCCRDLDKVQIKKELEEIYDNLNRQELLKTLSQNKINHQWIADMIKKMGTSDDLKDVDKALNHVLKIIGGYSTDKTETTVNTNTPNNLNLPGNSRD